MMGKNVNREKIGPGWAVARGGLSSSTNCYKNLLTGVMCMRIIRASFFLPCQQISDVRRVRP